MVLAVLAKLYFRSVPTIVTITTATAFGASLSEVICERKKKPLYFHVFTIMSYTSLGICAGIVYPIAFPAFCIEKYCNK